jgi:CelD/BcsL family acetyltransferase involved in cellulose biosynthesis
VGTWQSLVSPYISLPASWDEMQTRLHAKLKGNLRRRRKKLEELGPVRLTRVTGGPLLPAMLEQGFALESSGWKGAEGTAMAQDTATRGFYMELARHASYRGELTLYFLWVRDRPVAFHFGLESAGRYYLLKPGYDESLREYSPGQLLMEEVVKDCIGRGIVELDFLGPDMTWKRDWTDQARVHTWLYMFPQTTLGRTRRRAKFEWAPRAKERVRRWRS